MATQNWDRPAPELDAPARPNAAGLDRPRLRELAVSLGEKAFRGDQLYEDIYKHRWTDWAQFTNLSKGFRERLQAEVDLRWPEIVHGEPSGDRSTKHVFTLMDGRQVEGVHMPYDQRTTLCLSSQVGCAMACTFCATGTMGIVRNLTAGEIVGQVIQMLNAHAHPAGEPVNLVFMGMGEPMHNLDQVMAAFDLLTDPEGLAISPRRITVSTSGLVSGIEKLGSHARRPRLAVSLNATTDAYRSSIMPVNRVWNLDALCEALTRFPLQKGERITLEYVLLKGITDSLEDGKRLVKLASRFPAKVNLIPFNAHEGAGYEPPTEERIDELCALIARAGITVSVRRSRGQDVAAACGQLVKEGRKRPKRDLPL